MASQLLTLLVEPGVTGALGDLSEDNATAFLRPALENLFQEHGCVSPEDTVQRCMEANLLEPYGPRLGISAFGRQSLLLLDALEGGDIETVFRRLRRTAGSTEIYQLVRQGMTSRFFQSLVGNPGVGRLFFCSPWINPSEREAAILRHIALNRAQRNLPLEVLVITRPPDDEAEQQDGLKSFKQIGAKIYFHPRLHSKLYIREPDANGGLALAIVGSQNMTRSNYLELGIQITNDSRMIDDLTRYFLELVSYADEP